MMEEIIYIFYIFTLMEAPCTIYIYMVFITEGFFEVAIESWPEWDLNPQYIYI